MLPCTPLLRRVRKLLSNRCRYITKKKSEKIITALLINDYTRFIIVYDKHISGLIVQFILS